MNTHCDVKMDVNPAYGCEVKMDANPAYQVTKVLVVAIVTS